jgi:hypothetical protein
LNNYSRKGNGICNYLILQTYPLFYKNRATRFCTVVGTHYNKKVSDFPVPSRDVTNQTHPDREYFNYKLFYSVGPSSFKPKDYISSLSLNLYSICSR